MPRSGFLILSHQEAIMAVNLSILAFAVLAGSSAMALEPTPNIKQPIVAQAPAQEAPALSADALANLSGGAEPTDPKPISLQILTATNSGNAINADTVSSGAISLSGSVLSQASGVGNYVFNTGHNNNLQGSVTVNIIMGAPADMAPAR
jgi:hypothetical protein